MRIAPSTPKAGSTRVSCREKCMLRQHMKRDEMIRTRTIGAGEGELEGDVSAEAEGEADVEVGVSVRVTLKVVGTTVAN